MYFGVIFGPTTRHAETVRTSLGLEYWAVLSPSTVLETKITAQPRMIVLRSGLYEPRAILRQYRQFNGVFAGEQPEVFDLSQ